MAQSQSEQSESRHPQCRISVSPVLDSLTIFWAPSKGPGTSPVLPSAAHSVSQAPAHSTPLLLLFFVDIHGTGISKMLLL